MSWKLAFAREHLDLTIHGMNCETINQFLQGIVAPNFKQQSQRKAPVLDTRSHLRVAQRHNPVVPTPGGDGNDTEPPPLDNVSHLHNRHLSTSLFKFELDRLINQMQSAIIGQLQEKVNAKVVP